MQLYRIYKGQNKTENGREKFNYTSYLISKTFVQPNQDVMIFT